MSRKCETCFLQTMGKCPFSHACKFPVYERFGKNWTKIRFKEIAKLEQRIEAAQTYTLSPINRAAVKEERRT